MTKSGFLAIYETMLRTRTTWASDADKLARFMEGVRQSINEGPIVWNHEGDIVISAWRAAGGKGKPTYKALKALSN